MGFLSRFDAFHEQAMQATGLSDFGGSEYQAPMRLLLADLDRNTRLGDFGKLVLEGMVAEGLTARLRDEQGFKQHPHHEAASMERPLIILGMMRTGTTFLHRLIACDPALQTLPMWLACNPMRRPPRDTWEQHPAFRQAQQSLDQLYQLVPHFKQVHPQSAEAADEDRYLFHHSFFNHTSAAAATLPDYNEWLETTDGLDAYRYYRRTLALIGGGSSQRWLLKCPTHLWNLPALLDVFPDACVVITHRDPAKTVTSIISMVYAMRKMAEPDTTPEAYGREHMAQWGRLLRKSERERARLDQSRFFDIHADDVRADPVASIERIYAHFDIPVSDEARARWRQSVSADPTGGHAAHQYRPEDFGFTAQQVRDGAGAHYERFLQVEKARHSAG